MTSVPFGTLTGTPSMVRLTSSSGITRPPSLFPRPPWSCHHHRLASPRDVVFELVPELLDPGDDGRGARVRQDADRLSGHVLREVEQQVQVGHLATSREDALEDLGGPRRALTALGALRARLVRVETGEPHDLVDHVRRVVEHDDASRAEHRAPLDDALVVEQAAL